MNSPMTEFLSDLKKRLLPLNVPVYFSLPELDVQEPFLVIGGHLDDDSKTAKIGAAIVDTDLQIDLFYPLDDRAALEDMIYQVKSRIGRRKSITSNTVTDRTGARHVYHTIFTINEIVI
ncbi:hypothetical protein [Listeria booriae]|uniref:hypothetical protein n=1 Tax=Listeria booriae TaxID=1552123 RepID=UPI0016286ECC|nr:hypothetical protein [Listeria booriae]MBC1290630.1 hypothetical protein [Listeria booriae]MBC2163419.1 hypothetical protein [Listeria booriae]